MKLLERRASREARTYAAAQELIDAGYPLEDVVGRYPTDAAWLAPLLETGAATGDGFRTVTADPEFERTLHDAFLAAARRPSFTLSPAPTSGRVRTALAAATVAAAIGSLGVVTYGMVTADQAVPGDWNYTLKTTQERLADAFASGDGKVDVQIRQTEARVFELRQLNTRGDLSADDIAKFEREARELADMVRDRPLDNSQKARVLGILEGANVVLDQASQQRPELQPAVTSTRKTVDDAVAATGAGGVTSISEPTPAATAATPEPTPSVVAGASVTPQPSPADAEPTPSGPTGVTPIAVPSPAVTPGN